MRIKQSEFIISAVKRNQYPVDDREKFNNKFSYK